MASSVTRIKQLLFIHNVGINTYSITLTAGAEEFSKTFEFTSSPAFLGAKSPYQESLLSDKCTSAPCAPPGH